MDLNEISEKWFTDGETKNTHRGKTNTYAYRSQNLKNCTRLARNLKTVVTMSR